MGDLYFELLSENQMINFNKHCSQIDQLKAALDKKCLELVNRKHIIFHQDNARLHVSWMTRKKLLQLGWEALIHTLHAPNIAPLDFRLFWSLKNSLNGKKFQFPERLQKALKQFLLFDKEVLGRWNYEVA